MIESDAGKAGVHIMRGNVFRRLLAPECLVKEEHRLGELPDAKTAYKSAMHIALPSIIEMVLMSLIGSVDTMMVGNELELGTNFSEAVLPAVKALPA